MKKLFCLLLVVVLMVSIVGCSKEVSAKFPEKSIDLIIPWTAGSGTDVAGRLYAKYAEQELGKTINILNVPGGNGAVGGAQALAAEADGYTLMLLNYDILSVEAQGLAPISYKDFKLINKFSVQPTALIVRKDSGWENLEDYKNYALEHPGEIQVAVNGEGAVWHQAGILADNAMGVKTSYIPYNGSSEQVAALLGGHVDATYISYTSALQHLQEGTLIALGLMTEERNENIPDVPTFREEDFDAVLNSWRGIAVHKDTPDEVANTLRDAFKKAFDNSEYQQKSKEAKIDGEYQDHVEFGKFLDESYPVVLNIMKELGFAE